MTPEPVYSEPSPKPFASATSRHRTRVVALHLLRLHFTPKNNRCRGSRLTNWTNTGASRAVFRGHRQWDVCGNLSLCEARSPGARAGQAAATGGHLWTETWIAPQAAVLAEDPGS